jgi:excisionase family DNA binding protein
MSSADTYRQRGDAGGREGGRYYTVAQAAQELRVHRTTILRWIDAGRLRAYRVGPKAVRILERDLEAVVTPANAPRGEVTRVEERESPPGTIVTDVTESPARRLTEDEIRRGLAALKRLRVFREELAARHPGPVGPSSEELIREEREERSRRL